MLFAENCSPTKITNTCTVQWSPPPEPQYSMLSINLNLIQNYKTSKKCIHDICLCHSYMFRCGISHKTTKLQKNAFMIYAYVIHTCLDVALMEEDLYPSVISKKHLPSSHVQKHTTHRWRKERATKTIKSKKKIYLWHVLWYYIYICHKACCSANKCMDGKRDLPQLYHPI